jgi:hypothetical protein
MAEACLYSSCSEGGGDGWGLADHSTKKWYYFSIVVPYMLLSLEILSGKVIFPGLLLGKRVVES